MAQVRSDHPMLSVAWETLTHTHISVLKLFFLYAIPLSVLPPVMIHYAGITYGGGLLPELSEMQLQLIAVVFFFTEVAMTFLVAYIIQRLAAWVEVKPPFEDAYKLAVVVPTPLWFAPLFLFIPSFMLNLTVGAAAMVLSGVLIYYCTPAILKIEEKGHAMLLSGSILAAGMVAWAVMMYLTLFSWSFIVANPML